MDDFDLEKLVNLEQNFYDDGYKDGFDHGRIHGLIEGRALGREKGFEMWEELGFYEGFAKVWHGICVNRANEQDARSLHHIRHLLELISQFPRSNPSSAIDSEVDIPKLFRHIRSRYKALCSTLGVRPSLRAADGSPQELDSDHETGSIANSTSDDPGPAIKRSGSVWRIDLPASRPPSLPSRQDLTF